MTKNSNSTLPKILVTGATGKTGAYVVDQLLERGFPVRALVRTDDERAQRLAARGVEIAVGDFHDGASIRSAVDGVRRIYFCYPPQGDRLVEATAILAVASRDAGVEAVVNMSQITAREGAPSALSRHHWLAERVLDRADLGAVHLKPTFFAENLFMFGAATVASEGKLYLPYGDEQHAPVAAEDIARVAVQILADPKPHAGQNYRITGPRNMTIAEMAQVLGDELGRDVEYVDLPVDHWRQALTQVPSMNDFLADHLAAVAGDHQDGVFHAQTDVVERITGRAPQPLAEWVRANGDMYIAWGGAA